MSPSDTPRLSTTQARSQNEIRLRDSISGSSKLPRSISSTLQRLEGQNDDRSSSHAKRQDTNSTQASKVTRGSQGSVKSGETRRRQHSKEDWIAASGRPISRRSLPDFRKRRPPLYWPAPNEDVGDPIGGLCKQPNGEFRKRFKFQGKSHKSMVWSAAFKTHDGRDEHLAVKEIPCSLVPGTPEFQEKIQNEFEVLAKLEHNHIIAAVGSYVEREQGGWQYGLLLFPLAPNNLDGILNEVSQHNIDRGQRPDWRRHEHVDGLLDYLACLCRTIIYLHGLKKPIKHRDVKPANILVDNHGTVILADFDIAKQYTNQFNALTEGHTPHTERYASKAVKNGAERGFEWDVYSLGCVCLEVVTVALGETMNNLHHHITAGADQDCDYPGALERGLVDSWLLHLKSVALASPDQSLLTRFMRTDPQDPSTRLEEFLCQILAMMRVDRHRSGPVLESAWRCFSDIASRDCPHCHPKCTPYGNHHVPVEKPRISIDTAPTRLKPPSAKPNSNFGALHPGHAESNARRQPNQATHPKIPLTAASSREELLSRLRDLNEEVKQVKNLLDHDEPRRLTLPDSVPPFILTGASTSSVDDDFSPSGPDSPFTDSEYPTPRDGASISIDDREPPDDSATLPTTSGYRTDDDDPDYPPDLSSPVHGDNSSDTRRTSLASIDRDVPEQLSTQRNIDTLPKISSEKARVIRISQRGERSLQYLSPDAIRGTKVLEYSGLAFKTTRLNQVGQEVLNGAFFEIEQLRSDTKLRIPGTVGPGDTLHLRKALRHRNALKCLLGFRKYIYVPGSFPDEALEACAN